jgi:hypothetical protein
VPKRTKRHIHRVAATLEKTLQIIPKRIAAARVKDAQASSLLNIRGIDMAPLQRRV